MSGAKEWMVKKPVGDNFTVELVNLYSGTQYEIQSVSETADGKHSQSDIKEARTSGDGNSQE